MRKSLVISFGVLLVLSVVVWRLGVLTGAIVPLFGGMRAESIGPVGFGVGISGELCAYVFGWLWARSSQNRNDRLSSLVGPKKYGNTKTPT